MLFPQWKLIFEIVINLRRHQHCYSWLFLKGGNGRKEAKEKNASRDCTGRCSGVLGVFYDHSKEEVGEGDWCANES